MSVATLREALEPLGIDERPFAADKRAQPARRAPAWVAHLELPYRQWDGPKLPWAEDFGKGKGQVYARDPAENPRSCNEVEVVRRLRRVRQHAVWVSGYRPDQVPALWRPYAVAPEDAPAWLRVLDAEIRAVTGHRQGGIPDVVAWDDENPLASALFVECKGATESFKEGQEDWVSEALARGVRPEQIAVAVRRFV